ncbi:transglutaminase domain-containing protein [Lachnobacterium bovis]|uniref:transglutaminase domain-containing protein n=1 Tax=Lachnobacterium bovis TaxID=140626 RepID=UPI0003B74252|nr:transglutaminase domain-containing protein [Lachnobacterium bovis]
MKNVLQVCFKRKGMILFTFFMLLFIGGAVSTNKVMAAENESGYKQPTFEKLDNLKDYLSPEDKDESGYGNFGAQYYSDPYWTKFGSRTYYNKLNSEERKLYDDLYRKCDEVLNSANNCIVVGRNYSVGIVSYDASRVSESRAKDIAVIFTLDNPQFFFLNNSYTYGDYSGNVKVITPNVYNDFANGQNRNNAKQAFKAQLDNWYAIANVYRTKIQKLRKLEILIDESVTYVNTEKDQSAYSAVVEKRSVCAGYAKAYEMLCNAMGIEAVCLTSDTHQWVSVNMSTGWYDVDVTWDDDDRNDNVASSATYFLASAIPGREHSIQNMWNGLTPARNNSTGFLAPIYNFGTYVGYNSDVARAFGNNEGAVLDHFMFSGMSEQRKGASSFDVTIYRQNYSDLRRAFGNNYPLYYEHFLCYGRREGRNATSLIPREKVTSVGGVDYSLVYDPDYYVKYNADVRRAFGNDYVALLNHFVAFGMREGRIANVAFNVYSYKNEYPDLRRAYKNDFSKYYKHYIEYGRKEGRHTTGKEDRIFGGMTVLDGRDYSAVYDVNEYVNKYTDLKKAYGYDDEALLRHFVNFGMNEGRQAKSTFNVEIYKDNYADLRKAFRNNNKEYYLHYMNFGIREGRSARRKI